MDRIWAGYRYRTKPSEDLVDGWIALELFRDDGRGAEPSARVTYWDAQGQFSIQMFVAEIPLGILEEFILEAKSTIRVS